jgi:1-aminocyclopropane-1-carboxylate deaminase/D-cysteine desulfhydrase-like pyridoxal-dependent ACC family enzyme
MWETLAQRPFYARTRVAILRLLLTNANHCRAGYAVLTDAEREAIKLFAEQEGLLLDPVYTGRAAAA